MQFDTQQQKVIDHKKGHALILAGAGSGKTSTGTERTVQLIADGLSSHHIVMMTFTNKAAREMRQRIFRKLQDMGIELEQPPAVTTFHAFGQRIISKNAEACGREGLPSLLSEDDQESLLVNALKPNGNDYFVRAGMQFYDKIRNEGLAAGYASDETTIIERLKTLTQDQLVPTHWEPYLKSFIQYENEKQKINGLDYHDLLILPIHALKKDHQLLAKFRRTILDLTIDEAQDTNLAQYELIKLLAPPTSIGQSVLMIGDEDQSIHRWRGANPDNLRVFDQEYCPTQYRLEHNYRSLPEIVQRADKVIKHNTNRFDKQGIPTRNASSDSIGYNPVKDADDMANAIGSKIKETLDAGVSPDDVAILYRTNRMANLVEPALIARDIPYRIYNGQELLGRVESKIILSAIRFAINPRDSLAFKKLSELMPRVGQKMIDTLIESTARNETVFDAAMRLPDAQKELVFPMLKSILELRKEGPTQLLKWLEKQPEMRNWITKKSHQTLKTQKINKPKEFDVWKKYNRNEPISQEERALISANGVIDRCEKYQTRLNETIVNTIERMKMVCKTLKERCGQLQNNSLEEQWFEANAVIAAPPDEDSKTPAVTLMSIHSSKGLEWRHVHLAGVSNGILPFQGSAFENDALHTEDERRLAYVGFTRARDFLHIHHCDRINLMDGKGFRYVAPSPFVLEAGLTESPSLEELRYDGLVPL